MSKLNMKLAFAFFMYLPTAFLFIYGAKVLGMTPDQIMLSTAWVMLVLINQMFVGLALTDKKYSEKL
jgi:hypothetical protein|tara:strand:+ start:1028 stop:1228 length:201 start_codon:yes stop_codon:yes gene_type:complete